MSAGRWGAFEGRSGGEGRGVLQGALRGALGCALDPRGILKGTVKAIMTRGAFKIGLN
jgi:hypothetical protein